MEFSGISGLLVFPVSPKALPDGIIILIEPPWLILLKETPRAYLKSDNWAK